VGGLSNIGDENELSFDTHVKEDVLKPVKKLTTTDLDNVVEIENFTT
jgi:hypothetical protein